MLRAARGAKDWKSLRVSAVAVFRQTIPPAEVDKR